LRNRKEELSIVRVVSRRSLSGAAVQALDSAPILLRERVRRETASVIALAAEEVFAAEGLHAAHVEHIARRAGVAVGTLYNYYKDRDALLAALLRTRQEALFDALDAAERAARGRPIREQLHAFVSAKVKFLGEHRTFFRILFEGELTRMRAAYPTATDEHARSLRGWFDRVEALIQRGVESGELRAVDRELDAWLLGGMLRSVCVREFRENKACEPKDIDRLVHVFMKGAGS
jgi:AcrR family transcriptional regulator